MEQHIARKIERKRGAVISSTSLPSVSSAAVFCLKWVSQVGSERLLGGVTELRDVAES